MPCLNFATECNSDQLALFDERAVKGLDRTGQMQMVMPFASGRRVDLALHFALLCERTMSRGACGLHQAEELALAGLAAHHSASAKTRVKAVAMARRFFRYARARGLVDLEELSADLVEDFLWAPATRHGHLTDVSATTASNRQSHLRTTFRILHDAGVLGTNPIGPSITRSYGEPSRPLSAVEMDRLRTQSTGGLVATAAPLLVAFSEAGCSAGEVASVTMDDLDLETGRLRIRGDHERLNPLTSWGRDAVVRCLRLRAVGPGLPLCVRADLDIDGAAHSVTVRLRKLITAAGMGSRSGVTPRSISLTAAHDVLQKHGIEAAARFLGNDSLDATARSLHHQWKARS